MLNKVVARFADGRLLKGSTGDFSPAKDTFHLSPPEPGASPVTVALRELKAVFFVRDLAGNARYEERKAFDPAKPPPGRRIEVHFRDGEVLVGTTQGYQPGRVGFFLVPADPLTNNERCFILSAAVKQVAFISG
jgi:hypothetical protein